jgi:hypothetical protein
VCNILNKIWKTKEFAKGDARAIEGLMKVTRLKALAEHKRNYKWLLGQ